MCSVMRRAASAGEMAHMPGFQPAPGCIRCVIYTRISKDALGDGHGIANQLADLKKRATARGWTGVPQMGLAPETRKAALTWGNASAHGEAACI
jgi:hypothetical protein